MNIKRSQLVTKGYLPKIERSVLTLGEQAILKRLVERSLSGSSGFAFTTHAPTDIAQLLKTNGELRKNLLIQNKRTQELEAEIAMLRGATNGT